MNNTKFKLLIAMFAILLCQLMYGLPGRCAPQPYNYIMNGSMSFGGDSPFDWNNVYTASGKGLAIRDTDTFRSGPASLRFQSVDGPVNGNVDQTVMGLAGHTICVSGWVMMQPINAGIPNAQVAILIQDQNFHQIGWVTVCSTTSFTVNKWTYFSSYVPVPTNTGKIMVMLYMKGEGCIWLDDISAIDAPVHP